MKNLIDRLELLEAEVNDIKQEIYNYSDGYIYKLTTYYYKSEWKDEYKNYYSAKSHMDEYYGDNGIVILETNNKKFAEEMSNHPCLNGESVIIIE